MTPAFAPTYHGGAPQHAPGRVVCCTRTPGAARPVSRRGALTLGAAALAALAVQPSGVRGAPVTEALESVSNPLLGYTFSAPTAGWTKNTTTVSGMRELVVYVKDGSDGATNVSMVGTPIQGDFKKLTSFGTMDNVTRTLVPDGQGGVQGRLIAAELDTKKNAYVVEYTITPSLNEPTRHLLTVFSLQPGRYILTLTAQTTEDLWAQEEPFLRCVTDSYQIKLLED